jgi:penicillin amidase
MLARMVFRLLRYVLIAVVVGVIIFGVYVARVALATKGGVATTTGTLKGFDLTGPVTIARDARGVPHVRARSVHDLFFAEGYAMGSDRLFQMDLTRRYVDGRLAEALGSPLAPVDRRMLHASGQ